MVNKTQLHPVGSFAERHPANSPHGDFSLTFTPTFPQPTENISNSILSGEMGRFTDKCIFLILVDSIIEIITEKG